MKKTVIKVNQPKQPDPKLIRMADMEPCQVGIVRGGVYDGQVVMRTASRSHFEIISFHDFRPDTCWTHKGITHKVEIVDAEIVVNIK